MLVLSLERKMPDSFGGRLRQRREEQQITLSAIAEQTKIKQSLLEALERDDVSHWPAGIFRRAFIRAYALAIGLNPDEVVREFLEIHPDPIEEVVTASMMALGADEAARSGPPTRLRYLVGSAIGSLARRRQGPAPEELVPPAPVRVEVPAPAVETAPRAVSQPSPASVDVSRAPVVDHTAAVVPAASEPDLEAVARLCTDLGRVESTGDVQSRLQEAAGILEAVGVIVWVWDELAAGLRPALAYGYSDTVLAQLPTVRPDADNATAAAFRAGELCAINGSDQTNGALVAPLLTPRGCAGVLAIELPHGSEGKSSVRAVVTIMAAQLSQLMCAGQPAEVGSDAARAAC
jgi:transcriptional regulator with XRE-family HTH domain